MQLDAIDINQDIIKLQQEVLELQQSGLPLYSNQTTGATIDLWQRSLERIIVN